MKHNEFWQNDPAALAARGGAGAGAALPAAGLCGTGGGRDPGDGVHQRRSLRHGVHGEDHPAG